MRLLDIGIGNASQTEFFARHAKSSFGIDLQVSRLVEFRRDLMQRGIFNIHFLGGNAESLSFKNNIFDFVTCFEVLEHVENQLNALKEILRVLKPGGTIILSVPHRWWIFETHGASLPLLPWHRVPFFSWLPKNVHDRWARARIYTQKEISEILDSVGFEDVRTVLLTAPMDVVKNRSIQKLLRRTIFSRDISTLPFLASNIFACAKRPESE
jgi:ubiquinone/menaquinone biosynthesis C-methylase UbiE